MMPLAFAPVGKTVCVARIAADGALKKHLNNLGLLVQAELCVLASEGGSLICRIGDARIALDKQLGAAIFVTVKEN